jgi:hypothetical protein
MTSGTTAKAGSTALCKGVNYLERTVYAFNNLNAPATGRTILTAEAFSLTQESTHSGVIEESRKQGKGSPVYQKVKTTVVPAFCWSVSRFKDNYRKSANVLELSGLIYFDRDEAGDIQELSVIPELVGAWTSFGGKGDGFLVAVEGLTVHNFKSTWNALQDRYKAMGLTVDASCSNIDRANVLSYSAVLLADEVTPFQAVEPLPKPKPLPVINPLQDADETYTRLKKGLENKGWFFISGSRHNYIFHLACSCNRCGIDPADATAWMVQEFESATGDFTEQEIRNTVSDAYKRNASEFGTRPLEQTPFYNYSRKKKEEPKKPALCAPMPFFGSKSILIFSIDSLDITANSEYSKAVEHKLLEPGQRLSDLAIDFREPQYIDAPTATGKTAAVIKSNIAVDLLVPTQDQAKQIAYEYGIDYVIEGQQPTDKPQQAGTYNALQKFLQRDTSGRTLAIDEAHNLALAQGYRSDVLNNILDQAPKYKNIVLLSGTPVKSSHPLLKALPQTRVTRTEAPKKELQVIRYKDQTTSLLKCLERGKLETIVLQDKDKGHDLAALLKRKGYVVQCFNASTKEETHHREIIEQCTINSDVEVLIVTGLFFEGLNIYNNNIGSVHLLSKLSRYHMEQLFNRYRKQAPERLIQYRSINSDINQDIAFNWDEKQEHYLKCAEWQVQANQVHELHIQPENKAAQLADDILKGLQGKYKHLTRFNGTWQVNYLGVDYLTVQAETEAMHGNVKLLEQLLSEYGFTFSGIIEDTDDTQEHTLKDIAANRKEAQQARQAELIALFESGGMGYVMKAAESRNVEEAATAQRVLELEKYIPFLQAIALLREPLNDSKYRRLREQVKVQKYRQLSTKSHISTPETRMIDTIYALFQERETVTAEEVRDRLQKVRSKHFRTQYTTFTNETAIRTLKQFFEVERTTRYNAGKENCYRIISNNPLNITLQQQQLAA